ncbi:H-type small acid-soluble spore protein [Alkalihalobacterium chitinilyticum]|uniref:Small, acid-soluble spore protein H n=1 Tax=Alkalihalobacterium chitinilyticum TaxID=2980103 RepID=A0ABT5V9J9_9BACI|nr:H-type small acid-soluble spore protein [Alkalihalobacterium chitinilyticum]MDE5412134.1 H-type small acid-soluble spore protein [Alkalihalobacterium chitinilyticum]
MNSQRAQEIVESMKDVQVLFNGTPVMIQHVDHDNDTARVYEKSQPEHEMTVPVQQLMEQ